MKYYMTLSAFALTLVLVGAGCSTTTNVDVSTDTSSDTDATMEDDMKEKDTMGEESEEQVEEKENTETEENSEQKKEEDTTVSVDVELKADTQQDKGAAMEEQATDAVAFSLTGNNFSFSQKELRVKKGQTVTVNFESESGFHDFVVDEFNAATAKVQTGSKTSVTFVADKAGTFEYYCSVGSHRANGMVGKLIVE